MIYLHPQLVKDCFFVGELPLCTVMLMDNSLFPWVILVPKRENAVEIFDLEAEERTRMIDEVNNIAKIMKEIYWPDKMNIAALGNQVPQLHIHIIARFKTDTAWPNPVWGKDHKPYTETGKNEAIEILRRDFKKIEGFVTIANSN